MLKTPSTQCWSLLLIISLILTFFLMFTYGQFVPRQLHFWNLFGLMRNNGSEIEESAPQLEFFMPPEPVEKQLKLKRGAPFIYQILH
ncbi:LOW QUALITY PROTEIN: uncharacterized protein LOC132787872 [Drosophila nasuta]|uniref:LOW QUALITY PROTEIN: uncharacterized protein LOC132787872 n=1 Tax=Drosophila nasuta TaxID=42062 RepID=UPI00295E2199|nr:LOW QUALITY PROTEIN: uncharacterized protein LOC132787872 [Drosophila nasuta]